MNQEQIIKGAWHIEGEFAPSKDSITLLEDYEPTKNIGLWITQTNLKPYAQNKLIDKWCQKLPELTEIRFLWLTTRVNQKIFDSVCQMENLEGLWIKWSGIKTIDKIKNINKLRHLHIGSSSQIESIDVLGEMKNLKTLETEQLNKITDFSPISNLTQLEGLGVDGSIWTPQKIDNLRFLEPLQNLKYFTMTNSQLKDKTFDPILNLPNLVRFNSSWNYPESEFDKLKKMKNLKYGNVETSWKELKAELEKK